MRSIFLDAVADGDAAAVVAIVGAVIGSTQGLCWLDSAVPCLVSALAVVAAVRLLADVTRALRTGAAYAHADGNRPGAGRGPAEAIGPRLPLPKADQAFLQPGDIAEAPLPRLPLQCRSGRTAKSVREAGRRESTEERTSVAPAVGVEPKVPSGVPLAVDTTDAVPLQ